MRSLNYLFFLFRLGRCVKADPATLLTFFEVFLLLSSFEAILATLLDVCSFRAIFNSDLGFGHII